MGRGSTRFHTLYFLLAILGAGVGLGFWVVPSIHMLKTEYRCHICGKGFSGATVRDIG